MAAINMEKLVSLCKRRGFVFAGSEPYGGLGGTYDWGPLGVELVNNIKRAWWRRVVQLRSDVVGLQSTIIMNPRVWDASGHVSHFSDPMVDCKKCKRRFRADDLSGKCPECGGQDFTDTRQFNMMFATHTGPVEDSSSLTYLRPETAQGMFVDFPQIVESSRKKIPFGIAQIGKAFRNEITPSHFLYRVREFEQMEIEYFVKPSDWERAFEEWLGFIKQWARDIGLREADLVYHEIPPEERAHYSDRTVDIEFKYPFGTRELWGIAYRADFDLKNHVQASGKDFSYFDPETRERFLPHVIEPTFGVDRSVLAVLLSAYEEIEGGRTTTTEATKEQEIVLRLPPELAPIKVAVLPLSKKEPLTKLAREITANLRQHWACDYDEVASIGRRYRRQDEIGTPYCVTVDFESLEDQKVTVRDRDTMQQDRVLIVELKDYLKEKLA